MPFYFRKNDLIILETHHLDGGRPQINTQTLHFIFPAFLLFGSISSTVNMKQTPY